MELSKKEEAVIKAMREGAKITVNAHKLENLKEAENIIRLFDEFPQEKYGMLGFFNASGRVDFSKQMGNVELNCFITLEKTN